MIGRLVGHVTSIGDSSLIVDVGGVGYEVQVPTGTLGRTPSGGNPDAKVTLIVHTHAREDALTLFGFASEVERAVFRVLMAIPKVGAKTALLILSMLPPAELAAAVANRDLKRLTAISGVGKAMAERLLFELPKSLPKVGDLGGASTPLRTSDDGTRLLGALTNMGFRAAEAEKAVSGLSDRIGKEPLPELLKAALASLR